MNQNKRRVFTPRAKFSFKSKEECLQAKEVLNEKYPHLMTSISISSFLCYLFVESSSRRNHRGCLDENVLKLIETIGGRYLGVIS